MTAATTSAPMMLDWLLPEFDATLVEHRVVDGDPDAVYRAVAGVDMVEIPQRLPRRARAVRRPRRRRAPRQRAARPPRPPAGAGRADAARRHARARRVGQARRRAAARARLRRHRPLLGRRDGLEDDRRRTSSSPSTSPGSRRSPAACRCAPTGPRARSSPTRPARRRSTPTRARTSSATGASSGPAWRSSCARSCAPSPRRCADASRRPPADPSEAARAFGVVFGPSVVLDAAAGAALASALHALRRHRRPSRAVALASGLVGAYLAVGRPLMLHWGATCEELRKPLPGDELVPGPRDPVDARGHDRRARRGRLAVARPAGPGPRRLLQLRVASRTSPAARCTTPTRSTPSGSSASPARPSTCTRSAGLPVARFEPGRVLALEGWGAFVLEPHGPDCTRLIARGRTPRGIGVARQRAADGDPALRDGAQDAARDQGARRATPHRRGPPRGAGRARAEAVHA